MNQNKLLTFFALFLVLILFFLLGVIYNSNLKHLNNYTGIRIDYGETEIGSNEKKTTTGGAKVVEPINKNNSSGI